jgi:hypothetical protein
MVGRWRSWRYGGFAVSNMAAVDVSESFDLAHETAKMSPDAGQVFPSWLLLPGRSLAECARLTGKNESLVRQWAMRYGWKQLAARYDEAMSASLFMALQQRIVREAFASVEVAVEIRDEPTAKHGDRLKAAAWLASLGGLGPRSAPVGAFGSDQGDISGEDLRKLATSGRKEDLDRLLKITTGQGR